MRWVMREERPCAKEEAAQGEGGVVEKRGGDASNGRGVETPTPGDEPLMTTSTRQG